MTKIADLSENITSSLDLGDHFYDDVRSVVEGKLRDRMDKLLGKKIRGGTVLTEESITNTVQSVMENFLDAPVDLVTETANYYRKKYSLAI